MKVIKTKRLTGMLGCLLALVLILSLVTPAMAVPQIPHAFYGSVTVGGGPALDGTVVSAEIGGVEYARTTTLEGKYGYSNTFQVPGDDPETPGVEGGVQGNTIKFYIEGVQVAIDTFSNGEVTEFPLEIAELPEPEPEPEPDVGSGGGGGGGGYDASINLFGEREILRLDYYGKVLRGVEATSGNLTITIPKGTIVLDEDGDRLDTLDVSIDESPPDPPEGAHIIGLPYVFSPEGATFDPAVTLTWSYDPDALPEGVAEEDLVLAYYDEDAGKWVELDCVVDTANNTITASVSHFTTLAIIGTVTPPEEEEVVPPGDEEVVVAPPEAPPPTPPPAPPPVVAEPEPEPEPAPAPPVPTPAPPAPPLLAPYYWYIVGVVVVVAVIILFLMLRRRRD